MSSKHKNIVYDPISRRMFLQGLGGMLAIPLLPSLVENAFAQTASGLDARFIFMNVTHGHTHAMWNPLNASLAQVAAGVRAQSLSSFQGPIGYLIGDRFNDLRSNITMLQGLDASSESSHYWFPWTSSQSADTVTTEGKLSPRFHYSIDEVLARSSKIYPTAPLIDVLRIDPKEAQHTYSFTGTLPGSSYARTAGAEGRTVGSTWQAIASKLTTGTGTPGTPDINLAKKKFLVDRFLADSNQVVGSRQISTSDRTVFQNFIDQLAQIQRQISGSTSNTNPAPQCAAPNTTEPSDNIAFNQRLMDIMVLAMSCGVTKIGTYHLNWVSGMHPTDNLGDRYQPNVHDTIHTFNHQSGHTKLQEWWGTALDHYGYMVRRMKAMGLLDKSVVVFTSDFATSTRGHHGIDLPVLTAGGLNGKLRTGEIINFQDTNQFFENATAFTPAGDKSVALRPGRRYNEFLVTLFQAAGLTPAEYNRMGSAGFGSYDCPAAGCVGAEGMLNGKLKDYQASGAYPNQNKDAPLPYFKI